MHDDDQVEAHKTETQPLASYGPHPMVEEEEREKLFDWGSLEGRITYHQTKLKELGPAKQRDNRKREEVAYDLLAQAYGASVYGLFGPDESREEMLRAMNARKINAPREDENPFTCGCNLFYGQWKLNPRTRQPEFRPVETYKKYAYVMLHLFDQDIAPSQASKYIKNFDGKQKWGIKGGGLQAIIKVELRRALAHNNFTADDALARALQEQPILAVEATKLPVESDYGYLCYVKKNDKIFIMHEVKKSDEAKEGLIKRGYELNETSEDKENEVMVGRRYSVLKKRIKDHPVKDWVRQGDFAR